MKLFRSGWDRLTSLFDGICNFLHIQTKKDKEFQVKLTQHVMGLGGIKYGDFSKYGTEKKTEEVRDIDREQLRKDLGGTGSKRAEQRRAERQRQAEEEERTEKQSRDDEEMYRKRAEEQERKKEKKQNYEQRSKQQKEKRAAEKAARFPEACNFFDLPEDGNFSKEDVDTKYKDLMIKMHPDKMGNAKYAGTKFSKMINSSKDEIYKYKGW